MQAVNDCVSELEVSEPAAAAAPLTAQPKISVTVKQHEPERGVCTHFTRGDSGLVV